MTKNAWILVNRYCLTFNIYRPFLVDSSDLSSHFGGKVTKKNAHTQEAIIFFEVSTRKHRQR